jgi:glycosyltransferase involved in cell wall biosynthesis
VAGPGSVSFVIPAWRLDPFLVPAVESALAQSGIEVQVVLVLDGPLPVDRLDFAGHGALEVIELAHRSGTAAARNEGLRTADGDFVAVLDADDLADPDRAAWQSALLAGNDSLGLIGGSVRVIDPDGTMNGIRGAGDLDESAVRRKLLVKNPLVHSSTMARRRVLEAIGGYDESLSRFIDYDLYLRLATAGVAMRSSSRTAGSYRLHPGQLSSTVAPADVVKRILAGRRALARETVVGLVLGPARDFAWRAANSRSRPTRQ